MTLFRATPAFLQEYLAVLSVTEPMPIRCDLFSKPRFLAFFPNTKEGFQCLRKLFSMVCQQEHVLVRLKIMICLHHIVMAKSYMHEQILDQIIPNLNGFEVSTTNGDAAMWMNNIVSVYYNFIRKICANSQVYWQIRTGKYYVNKQPMTAIITRVYVLMNLIKSVFLAKDYILNFGRYFKAEYPIIIDVSKSIAHELGTMYNSVSEMTNYLIKNYKTKLNKDEVKQLLAIVDETYLVHQFLYVMFYNRYYAYDIDPPSINWVKMESQQYEDLKNEARGKKKTKRHDGSKVSIDSLDLSQFEKTYFSNAGDREDALDGIEI